MEFSEFNLQCRFYIENIELCRCKLSGTLDFNFKPNFIWFNRQDKLPQLADIRAGRRQERLLNPLE